jgi:hypothetical protein
VHKVYRKKKNYLFGIILLCSTIVFSQTTDSVKTNDTMKKKASIEGSRNLTVKINPLFFIVKGYEVSAEVKIFQRHSIQATLNHWNYSFLGEEKALSAFGEWRWYIDKSMPCLESYYVGSYLRYNKTSNKTYEILGDKISEYEFSTLSLSGTWGKQWITSGGFTINLFFGGGIGTFIDKKIIYERSLKDRAEIIKNNYMPNLRLGIGIGFAN